jgi:hypothetical protein
MYFKVAQRSERRRDRVEICGESLVQGTSDVRTFKVRVGGPAALLVAKAHKINERKDTSRQSDKDALDVLRLLRGTETEELATRFARLLSDKRSESAAKTGCALLEAQFAKRSRVGVEMAIRAAGALGDADEIAASCEALAGDLLSALK